jgi:hypothetical protein
MRLCPNDKACSILKAPEVLLTVKTPPRTMAGKPDERVDLPVFTFGNHVHPSQTGPATAWLAWRPM